MIFEKRVATKLVILAFGLAMFGCGGTGSPTPTTAPPSTPPPAAPTASLTANPNTVEKGQSTTLTWQTTNATDVSIDGLGAVQPSGSQSVTPVDSTTYTLTAKGAGGTQTAMATVTVTVPPPPPPPPPSPTNLAASYTFTLLPPLPGGSDSQALAINNNGVVAGYSTINGLPEATKWVNGQAIDLGPGYALAINDAGELAGFVVGPGDMNEAAHWLRDSGVSITIGLLDGFDSIIANSIDVDGTLSGTAFNSFDVSEMEAFEWTAAGGIVAVPQLIESFAIRNGRIVGISPSFRATIAVQSPTITSSTDLGVAGSATAINNQGDVVGSTSGDVIQAFFWSQGQLTLLGTGGALSSALDSINNSDLAVGNLQEPEMRARKRLYPIVDPHPSCIAVGWSKTDGFVQLSGRVQGAAGWILNNANGINDSGQIAGTATMTATDGTFITTGFILGPQ